MLGFTQIKLLFIYLSYNAHTPFFYLSHMILFSTQTHMHQIWMYSYNPEVTNQGLLAPYSF